MLPRPDPKPDVSIGLIAGNVILVLFIWFIVGMITVIPFALFGGIYESAAMGPLIMVAILFCWGLMLPPWLRDRLFWEKNITPNPWNVRIHNIILFLFGLIYIIGAMSSYGT